MFTKINGKEKNPDFMLQKVDKMGTQYTDSWMSTLFLVMALEMVLRGAKKFAQGMEVAKGQVMPPMNSFLDDITVLTEVVRWLLNRRSVSLVN